MKMKTENEIIELKDFNVKTGFHCESSAMMNALSFQGLELSENMIAGLGSAPAFTFPEDEAFPFFGARDHTLLENFCAATGLTVKTATPKSKQDAYDEAKEVLKNGIPVVLRTNMRYLPYLYEGKYGDKYTSFGWHFVCLVKIDEPKGIAWVTDTAYKGLQQIKLSDLSKARASKESAFRADNYFYYFCNPASVKIDYKKAFNKSIKRIIDNYEEPGKGLDALEKLPENIKGIESKRSSFIMKPLFYTFYGYIEEFGTGGSAFRKFLERYLYEVSKILNYKGIEETREIVAAACEKWSMLANEFKKVYESIESLKKDKTARKKMYGNAAEKAQDVFVAEKEIYNSLKSLYRAM